MGTLICMVTRTTVELDQEQMAEARGILGTTGIKDTIDAALDRVIRQAKRDAFLRQITEDDGLDLGPEFLVQARPRMP
jgi:Arc/MetJ family transcription regulator